LSDTTRRAFLVFTICAAPRLVALVLLPNASSTYYDKLAKGLLSTGVFGFDGTPSTYIEPLYPAFLAGARLVTGNSLPLVLMLQIVVASIGGVLLDRLASHHAGPRAGLFAALFYAVNPYLVRQSVALLEITLCTMLAIGTALALSCTDRIRGALATGALFGLLMLTRTSFAVAAIAAAAWLAWRGPSTGLGAGRPSVWLAAAMLLTALLVETTWLVRNARVDGSPLPSRVGENLYLSTSIYGSAVPVRDIDLLVPLGLADVRPGVERLGLPPSLEHRALDDAMLRRGLAFMREHPGRVLWLKARNALYLFMPRLLPRDAKSPEAMARREGDTVIVSAPRRPWINDTVHTGAQSVLLLLAAIGIARRGMPGTDAPLLILLAAQAIVCVAFFPTTRLMAPVMFVLMFYAATGLTGSSAAAPRQP
jgi:Dolichyl-phosphate-mannose-protein mannosyltransferase